MSIAVIGAGYWGQNLVRVLHQLGVLHTVCDTNLSCLEMIKSQYHGLNVTSSIEAILKNKKISAVAIATPSQTHYALARKCIENNKDVFVEKPLALKLKEGHELCELAQSSNKILMVGHLLEYHPAINKIKELIDQDEVGPLRYIYSNRLNFGKIRKEENILWSFAPHDISIIISLLNMKPLSVSVHGSAYLQHEIADITMSTLSFAEGIKGHIFVSWLHPYKEQKLVIVGSKKMLVFNDVNHKGKLLIYNHKIYWNESEPILEKAQPEHISISDNEPLKIEMLHFLDCLKTR